MKIKTAHLERSVSPPGKRRSALYWRVVTIVAILLGLILGMCVISPKARCRAINGVIWVGARTFPRQMGSLHHALEAAFPSGSVLLVGDSLIGQLPPSWVDAKAINLGIGGMGVAGVRAKLNDMSSLEATSALVLLVGTNDLVGKSALPAGVAPEMERLLFALPATLPVILCAVPPMDSRYHWERKPEVIKNLNEHFKRLVPSRPNTYWLDLHGVLADKQGNLPENLHQGDGLHFSAAGNRLVAAAIKGALSSLPASK